MPSPLPGMDPYLEAPALWPDVHGRLAVAICDQIQPSLSPRYTAVIVPYVAYESIDIAPARFAVPDVAVLDRGDLARDQEVAAVIAAPPLTGQVAMEVPTRYHRVEIRTAGDETVVTVIEILTPVNKRGLARRAASRGGCAVEGSTPCRSRRCPARSPRSPAPPP